MKHIFYIIIGLTILTTFTSNAQIHLASSGAYFEFKNGVEEWSEPIVTNLDDMKEKSSIPVSIRVKYSKKVMFACHYLCEITNLSETQSVKFSLGTGYTDYNGNDVVEKFSLKPKDVQEGKIMYAEGTKKPKNEAEDCVKNWSPRITFFETKIK